MNSHQILDRFEAAWAKDETPEVAEYIAQLSRNDSSPAIGELVKIDLERRWRSARDGVARRPLEHYLSLEQVSFSDAELVELIGWEYYVRNRWGDCPTRTELANRFPRCQPGLEAELQRIAAGISWPCLKLTVNHQTLSEIALSGPVQVGRQGEGDPAPVSLVQQPEGMRWIVAERGNLSLSRKQLQIRLQTPRSVQLTNSSRNRAVAICAGNILEAGATRNCQLPVRIHLSGDRFLQVGE